MIKTADRLAKVSPSATLKLTAKAKQMKQEGKPVIGFAAGEPDFDTPQPVKDEAVKWLKAGFTKYTPTSGTVELKEAVCKKFKEDQGLDYKKENVVISCGAKHSVYNLIQVLCNPGDEVIMIAPYWVSYPEMAYLAGANPVVVETRQADGFRPSLEKIKAAITPKTRVLILNSPSNPSGAMLTEEDLRGLAALIVEKNILCISDEIYEYYVYDAAKHVSIASLGDEVRQRTFIVNGVSKSYSMTGLRIGYIAGDAAVIKKIGMLQDHSTSCPTSISQKMALAALNLPAAYRRDIPKKFKGRGEKMLELIKKAKGFEAFKPQGAFYVFCDISKTGMKADELCGRLLEEALVAVIPGTSFGSDRHVRFSFACSEKDIEEGMARIIEWAKKEIA